MDGPVKLSFRYIIMESREGVYPLNNGRETEKKQGWGWGWGGVYL